MGMIRVKPGTFKDEAGQEKPFVIRDPATLRLVPEEGIDVSDTDAFWDKLLAIGDVVKVAAPVDEKPSVGRKAFSAPSNEESA